MARKYTYVARRENTPELILVDKIKNGEATRDELTPVVLDIEEHLKTPAGTLANYRGKYGSSVIKALQTNYNMYLNHEMLTYNKIHSLYSSVYTNLQHNLDMKMNTTAFNMLVDYMSGKSSIQQSEQQVKYIISGFPLSDKGKKFTPQPKILPDKPPEKLVTDEKIAQNIDKFIENTTKANF